jgi:hypothetical protein
MKRIDLTKPGGFPEYQDTLKWLQDAYTEPLQAIVRGLVVGQPSSVISLTAKLTESTNQNGNGVHSTQGGWIIWPNGELLMLDAGSVTYTGSTPIGPYVNRYIDGNVTLNPATYQDGSTHSPYKIGRARLVGPNYTGPGFTELWPIGETLLDQLQTGLLEEDPWHFLGDPNEPAFNGTWGHLGNFYERVGFRQDKGIGDYDARVWLKGHFTGNSDPEPATVFTLPPGYRPNGRKELLIRQYGSVVPPAIDRLYIQPDGRVRLGYGADISNAPNFLYTFDGLSFSLY